MSKMTEEEKQALAERKRQPIRMEIDEYKQLMDKILKITPLTAMEIIQKIDKGDNDFSNARIVGLDWAGRNLSGYNFENSILQWVSFSNCKLIKANFSNAHIEWTMFSKADLTKAKFEHADIWNTAFDSAILDDTSFRNANLRYILFADANTSAADFFGAFKFKNFENWRELSDLPESEWNVIFDYMRLFGLSNSQIMFFKSQVGKVKSAAEKIKFVYNFGISSFGQDVYLGSSTNEISSSKGAYTSADAYTVADPYASKRTKSKEERQSYKK